MKKVNVVDEVQLKCEFRRLYKDLGSDECIQVLYELIRSAEIMCEVLKEEADGR